MVANDHDHEHGDGDRQAEGDEDGGDRHAGPPPGRTDPRRRRKHHRLPRSFAGSNLVQAGLELATEVVHRRESIARLLCERPGDCCVEARRNIGPLLRHPWRSFVDVLHRDRHEVVARERHRAREHFVEDDSERVDVGVLIHPLALGLLGRDVVGRAEHRAGLR